MQCWRLLRVRELHGVISAEHAAFSAPRGRGARAQRRGSPRLRAPAEGSVRDVFERRSEGGKTQRRDVAALAAV